jgi:hypothetical protein
MASDQFFACSAILKENNSVLSCRCQKKEFKDFIDDIQTAINKQLIKVDDLERISMFYSLLF